MFQPASKLLPTRFLPSPQTPGARDAHACTRAHARETAPAGAADATLIRLDRTSESRCGDGAELRMVRAERPTRLFAVDIGRSGALALFADNQLVEIIDMPVLADGPAGRPTINAPLLAALIRRLEPDEAVVEHVAARPGEAAPGAFAFGRSRGVIEGVLGAQAIPVRFVTPAAWKRRVGIPPGRDHKDMARSIAISRWPHFAETFSRKLDHDRAEACLIGAAYLEDRRR